MGRITTDQSHQIMAALATNVSWDEIDFDGARLQDLIIRNAKRAGAEFTAFLKAGARMNLGPYILHIDRSRPFDPVAFIGQGGIIEEQDDRSLALTEIDLTKIQLVTMLKPSETGSIGITGEERLKRLKRSKHVRLDAKIFQTFWENQDCIPAALKEKANGKAQFIFFDGTVLRVPFGGRCALGLCFFEGTWSWDYRLLDSPWRSMGPSVVLASI